MNAASSEPRPTNCTYNKGNVQRSCAEFQRDVLTLPLSLSFSLFPH